MKKNQLFAISFLVIFLAFSVFLALTYLNQPLETRNQASTTCAEAPVNVQFRMYTGKDTAWFNGSTLTPKVNDAVEVNCFAKNGAALLTGGKITVYNGTVTAANILTTSTVPELRNYKLTKSGKYTFVCENVNKTCSDQDGFTVTGTSTTPTDPQTPSNPGTNPAPAGISDLNKNGKADPDDYRLFLEDYLRHL
jgi:hypothetical protein